MRLCRYRQPSPPRSVVWQVGRCNLRCVSESFRGGVCSGTCVIDRETWRKVWSSPRCGPAPVHSVGWSTDSVPARVDCQVLAGVVERHRVLAVAALRCQLLPEATRVVPW